MRRRVDVPSATAREDTAPRGTQPVLRSFRERTGVVGGRLLGPPVRWGARARHTRLFHPTGLVFAAQARAMAPHGPAQRLGERLEGHAVLRFSGALWKRGRGWPDVLGCAIRFCDEGAELSPGKGAQDLLLATVRSPATLGLAPFATRTRDYLANIYYGVSPFALEGLGVVKLRLRPEEPPPPKLDVLSRAERLLGAVEEDGVQLLLEWKRWLVPEVWRPLVELRLVRPLQLDQQQLRFNPFLAGRGLHPRGFIHALRRAAYPQSRIGSGAASP